MNIADATIQPLLDAIQAAGGRPLLVGGAVRDALLGVADKDLDVEVYDLPIDDLARVLERFGRVDAVGRAFGILKLRLPGGREVDVSLPRRESKVGVGHRGFLAAPDPTMTPEEAAARRDFTWNALAMTPEGKLLDYYGGRQDLRDKIVRHTSPAFVEDPLRVLRAMQLAARLDMRLAPETAELSRQLLPEASTLAVERIWREWQKWALKSVRPSAGLRVLAETGWLSLYPELAALQDCPQDSRWHPEGDVFTHTGLVCDAAAEIATRDALPDEERVVLLFAALCHDLGKPATTTIGEDGRIRSLGHDQAGVEPSRAFLRRIGCPRAIEAQVVQLVREHMAHYAGTPSLGSVRRLAARLHPATIALWGHLVEADHSARPPLPPNNPARQVVELAAQLDVTASRPAPILQGRHLLGAGWVAGPQLGEALRRAYEAQLDGAFSTPEEGMKWLDAEEHGE